MVVLCDLLHVDSVWWLCVMAMYGSCVWLFCVVDLYGSGVCWFCVVVACDGSVWL